MTINLITKEEYDTLLRIQQDRPILTFQNNGYEYINKSKFSESDTKAFEEVTSILKKCIVGFHRFDNFRHRSSDNNKLTVRFQYNWTADDETNPRPYEGVGYLLVEELLNGFKEIKKEEFHGNKL